MSDFCLIRRLHSATIALLNATLNIQTASGVELGDELNQLKSFSEELDYETRGHVLTNSEKLRIGARLICSTALVRL